MTTFSKVDFDGLWTQEGTFTGAGGEAIAAYDDVLLKREVAIESSQFRTDVQSVQAGATGTVIFFTLGADPIVEIELDIPVSGCVFALEEGRQLQLYMTNEEKYPR